MQLPNKRMVVNAVFAGTECRPFLRWAGSKRAVIPQLSKYWSPHYKRYIEPFMGSACLFFALRPQHAVLGDINEELVNCFLCVRDHPLATFRALSKIPISKQDYYALREKRIPTGKRVERAARVIYLNRFCFNGLYRTNLHGKFNVPFSSSKTGSLPNYDQLKAVSRQLENSEIRLSDFEELLRDVRKGDFVYLDPPFAVSDRRIFREYGPTPFNKNDLHRLSKMLKLIDTCGAHFLVSYAYCKEGLATFQGWSMKRVVVQRNISGFSKYRRRAVEMLVTNIPIDD